MSGDTPRYRPVRLGGALAARFERRSDGAIHVESDEPLAAYPRRLTDRLLHWAAAAPERSLFMIAPGISGNPLSPWFGHLAAPWSEGRYFTLTGDAATLRKTGVGDLVLKPKRRGSAPAR